MMLPASRPRSRGPLTLAARDLQVMSPEEYDELWQPTWWMDDDELDLPDHAWTGGFPEPIPPPLSQKSDPERPAHPGGYKPHPASPRAGPRVWMRGPFGREVKSRRDSGDWRRLLRHGYLECGELPRWSRPHARAEWLVLSGRVEGAVRERRAHAWRQPHCETFRLEWLIDQAVDGCDLACINVRGRWELMWLQ